MQREPVLCKRDTREATLGCVGAFLERCWALSGVPARRPSTPRGALRGTRGGTLRGRSGRSPGPPVGRPHGAARGALRGTRGAPLGALGRQRRRFASGAICSPPVRDQMAAARNPRQMGGTKSRKEPGWTLRLGSAAA
jgi:hypothetical protein